MNLLRQHSQQHPLYFPPVFYYFFHTYVMCIDLLIAYFWNYTLLLPDVEHSRHSTNTCQMNERKALEDIGNFGTY